jgi:dTDP-glucose 4,6-dehydratase
MSERTVVVLGSNSFSGSDFVDLLLDDPGYRVIGVSRSPENTSLFLPYKRRADLARFTFHQMDLNRDADGLLALLARERPAFVVNFAAQSEVAASWDHPEQWYETNAVSTARLGNFLCRQDWLERYLHISTPEVYGNCEGNVGEDAPMNPSTPYAASRAAAETFLQLLVRQFGLRVSLIRSSNVYGAHQQLFKIMPRAVIRIRKGEAIELHGGGTQVRSFIHIRDVSRGELAAMLHGGDGEAYNLSPDASLTIRDLVETICARMGVDAAARTTVTGARPGNDARYTIDSTKARRAFGWRPEIPLARGLDGVIAWIDDNWQRILREPLEYVHKP